MGHPDEGGGEYTSIDVDALGQAVDDLGATLTGLTDHIAGLETDFGYFGVSKTNLNKLLEAKSDLENIMPDMRRRHSLAVQLLAEYQSNGWSGDGVLNVQGTDILNDDFESIEDAQQAGRELADQVNNGDGEVPPEVYEQLEQYGHDPDFAEAFINQLSPASRGLLLIDADQQATAYGDEANDGPQLAVANVFSTASFRIDYDEAFIGGINQALLDKGLHPDGIRIVDRISALTQHGSWDHGSLVAFSEAALHGDESNIGRVENWAAVYSGLARNPRASAEYMAEHREDVWNQAQVIGPVSSEEDFRAAFADFMRAATVDSRGVYARLRLYDENQPNLAEQNAAYLVNQVGGQEEPFPFFDEYRVVFTDITEEYWDDLVYSMGSPGGVSDNPGRDGIEVDPSAWQAFVTEGMRDPDSAARLHQMMYTWYGDYIQGSAGSENGNEHFWDDLVSQQMAAAFQGSWDTVLGEIADDEAAREEFIGSLVDFGFSLVPPDPQALLDMGKDAFIDAMKNTITQAIVNAGGGEAPPELSYDFANAHKTWVATAVAEYNAGSVDPYNDGDVTWEADPSFYEELYGGRFTDSSGNVISPFLPSGQPNPEFPDDPASLQAFNQWAQDPAMQVYIGENHHGRF
ncbi:hypothetical protein E1212_03045 [Jiangella ureilytica]|uniref:Uncharacterized protein n=1 Tax=Jiangella ureilytica TaxID=2530374 RepID=A0A4R4RW79_9ACTN|nr:hypothetical protein [Jiangella ureilytica]TDC54431.1 hypothetical protein E1212_03045 [Jiangella ureilytica]